MLPVGITLMFSDNEDHSNHAGGTWESTSVGRVPVGIDTGQTEFDVIGETGGAKTHTLTTAQMPQHKHTSGWNNLSGVFSGGPNGGAWVTGGTPVDTGNTGSGNAHNNIQPSITVYRYRRTA